jgi:hypothetical protein
MTPSTTVDFVGKKHIDVADTGNNNHCSVFLAVALNGAKLKPLVVFKAKPGGSVESEMNSGRSQYDPRVACVVQENGYCDERVMGIWIEKCLKLYLQRSGTKTLGLLMMDNFSAHGTQLTRSSLADNCCLLSMLPPNMTSRVQILDVGVNKPFKDYMRAYFNDYITEHVHDNPKVTREMMSKWIANAWEQVKVSTIINTCKKIGFID